MRPLAHYLSRIPFYGIALAALIPAAVCQTATTGEITGMVVDPAGKSVIGATVQLKSIDTGESRAVRSDASGAYRIALLKPGVYEISGKSEGLKSDVGSLVAAVGQVQVLDLHLKLEEAKTVVLVTDAAPLLNRDNANLVYTLSTQQLELLPLPGGDLVSVAYSAPGVVINSHRYSSQVNPGNFVLQGVGSVSTLFTVNGVDDMDPYTNGNNSGTTGMLLGANEVREASIVQNAFEGQYGRQAGAQVNYVTKSGTNTYHGNLVYSYNGTRLNANDFFANAAGVSRPLAISNQYAASLGGPVVRNKLFFFADTEGLRFALPIPNHVAAIPSPALQSYALTTIQPSQVPFYQKMFDLYNRAPGIERAVPVANGNGPLQDNRGNLGCGKLAGTRTATGGVFGIDVSCAQAWETNTSTATSEWLVSTRADYNLSANQRVFSRFKTDHGYLPFIHSDVSPLFDVVSRQPDYEGQLNHTLLISPRAVNNFIVSVTYNDYTFDVPDLIHALQAFPDRIQINDRGTNGGSIAQVGAPANYPQGRRAAQFQIVDDISHNRGSHSFKAGVNYRYNPESDLAYAGFTSVGKFTLFGLDQFAKGVLTGSTPPGRFAQNFTDNPVHHLRLYNLGAYIQDQWALAPRLKITTTIRFDRTGNPDCVDRCFARLAEPFPELSKGTSIPYNQSIHAGLAHAFSDIETIVPQPRFSLAYSPGWSPNTVFRGGVGLFSDMYPAAFAGQLGINPPNTFFPSIPAGLIDAGGAGSAPAIAAMSAHAFAAGFGSGATLGQLQQAVAPALFAPPLFFSMPASVQSPKSLQWTFELQHRVRIDNVISVRYMGNHGYDIFLTNANVNANADRSFYPNGFGLLPATTPDPRFGVVQQLTNDGYANYHALMVNYRHALHRGLQGQISYTWSHALDTISNGGIFSYNFNSISGQINPASLRSVNYSNADYDVRHGAAGDLIWQVPRMLQSRLLKAVFGGWSVGVRLAAHTGSPFSVTNGAAYPSSSFGGVVLADVLRSDIRTACGRSAIQTPCFTAAQFAPARTQSDFGNLPRNSFRGPGYFNVDSTLFKTVIQREPLRLALGASAYNLLNHPNFPAPQGDISASGLGLITFTELNPSGPYGRFGGPSGRAVVVTGKLTF